MKNSDLSGHLTAVARALSEPLDKEPNSGGSQKTLKGSGTPGVRCRLWGMDADGGGSLLSPESGGSRSKIKNVNPILPLYLRGNKSSKEDA